MLRRILYWYLEGNMQQPKEGLQESVKFYQRLRRLENQIAEIDPVSHELHDENDDSFEQSRPSIHTPHGAERQVDLATLETFEQAFPSELETVLRLTASIEDVEFDQYIARRVRSLVSELTEAQLQSFAQDPAKRGQFILSNINHQQILIFLHKQTPQLLKPVLIPDEQSLPQVEKLLDAHILDIQQLLVLLHANLSQLLPSIEAEAVDNIEAYRKYVYKLVVDRAKNQRTTVSQYLTGAGKEIRASLAFTAMQRKFVEKLKRAIHERTLQYLISIEEKSKENSKPAFDDPHAQELFVQELEEHATGSMKSLSEVLQTHLPGNQTWSITTTLPSQCKVEFNNLSVSELKAILTNPRKNQDFIRTQLTMLLIKMGPSELHKIDQEALSLKDDILEFLQRTFTDISEDSDERPDAQVMKLMSRLNSLYYQQVTDIHAKTGSYFCDGGRDIMKIIKSIQQMGADAFSISIRHDDFSLLFDIHFRAIFPKILYQELLQKMMTSIEKALENACLSQIKLLEQSIEDRRKQIAALESQVFKGTKSQPTFFAASKEEKSEDNVDRLVRLEELDAKLKTKQEKLLAASKTNLENGPKL